ncbi:MAG: alanine racemase [Myxococcaceae bacterium]|nr:alanine racemase [Myxococcaceae bacterium]
MIRPRYERPTLIRHVAGMMNKYARVGALKPLSHVDGVPVARLVEQFGSPLFVFSERTIVQRQHELKDALALRFPRSQLAWSYKTNYLDAVCRVFHREGSWAEVVSELEFDKARRLGVPGEQILFNGPFKPESALDKAFSAGARVHLDHFDEILRAERVAERRGLHPKVTMRVNLAVPGTPAWSRFGFNLENGQALDAAKRLRAGGRLELAGLHCHIGTFVQDVDSYRQEAKKLALLANQLQRELGVRVDTIDLGGGLASRNTLHAQYLPGDQVTPSLAQYVEAIAEGLEALDAGAAPPTIVLESGRALIDEAGFLVTTVHATKRLPDGRRALVLDAGVNALVTANWYKHDVVPAQDFAGMPEPTVMYGPLCMNIDVLRDQLLFPPVAPGDRLVFKNVGAYNVTQWMQFIVERPAVVLVSRSGEPAVIRRRESLDTLVSQEELPPWLR